MRLGCLVVLSLLAAACSTVYPLRSYVIAREAVDAAREVESARYAPGFWYKAEEAYRKAKREFDDQQYHEAIDSFKLAQLYAEKAENSARYQRQRSGEETP